MSSEKTSRSSGAAALMVGAGIFLSRIAGFLRSRALAHYLGNSDAADAFTYALKFPNLLQNLFGEGVLSASFIPVYARLLAEGREEEARKVAGAVASLLFFAVSILVLAGILAAPLLVDIFAAGYGGEKRAVCVQLVRIIFPGTGLLVLSAWCLGVLNSHRLFFLSYVAPVLWNAAIIVALMIEGQSTRFGYSLATAAAFGSVAGSALQLFVQLPFVLKLLRGLPLNLGRQSLEVRSVGTSFVPVVLGRGVAQISSWVDTLIASFLLTGAMAGLGYAQMLYLLPISLFGMAVSAAELPEMSRVTSDPQALAGELGARLQAGLRRIAFFVVPSAIGYLALGDRVVALVYRTGKFSAADEQFVWAILAGFAVGLLAATQGRLVASVFYALRDTNTPFRIAVIRMICGTSLGAGMAFFLPGLLHIGQQWGVVGLALASGMGSWLELILLRRALRKRLNVPAVLPFRLLAQIVLAAAIAAAIGWGAKLALGVLSLGFHPALESGAVLGVFGLVYLGLTLLLGLPEAHALTGKLLRRLRPRG